MVGGAALGLGIAFLDCLLQLYCVLLCLFVTALLLTYLGLLLFLVEIVGLCGGGCFG